MPWAVSCDGIDDYIDLGTLGNFGSQRNNSVIEITFKTPRDYAPGAITSLFGQQNASSGTSAWLRVDLCSNRNQVYAPGYAHFYHRDDDNSTISCEIHNEALYDGEYHTLLIDYRDSGLGRLKVFVDDVEQQITYRLAYSVRKCSNFAYPLVVGASNAAGLIYRHAEITVKRIKITLNDQPHAEYPIDEGQGNIIHDISGNDFHGTIYGATWVWESGEVPISTTLRGSSSAIAKADRIRGLSAHLTGAATATGGTPIRIRGLSANLAGTGTVNAKMNLIAALEAHLQGKAALKSNILVLFIPEGVYVIDADEIFAKDQPSRGQVVANYIEVWVNPLKPTEEPEEVYRSKDPITIPAGTTKTITIHFDDEPVTEPAVALEEAGVNLSIVDTKYYAWGADVKIKNTGSSEQTCIIVANGRPLKVQGREKVVRKDEVSIQENGLKKYTFDNPFVQDRATAELIADKLLSFANAKRDIVIEWRGDPALELADVTMIPEYQRRDIDQRGIFYVTKQELEFDGGLRAKLEGRKM